jgi:hypothetical protein
MRCSVARRTPKACSLQPTALVCVHREARDRDQQNDYLSHHDFGRGVLAQQVDPGRYERNGPPASLLYPSDALAGQDNGTHSDQESPNA